MKIMIFLFSVCMAMSTTPGMQARQTSVNMVTATKEVKLAEFSSVWNPSLIKINGGFLVTFRYCLAPAFPWISYIGAVLLDENLEVASKPQLLATRHVSDITSSQAEDARVFTLNGEIYIIYNDNVEIENPTWYHHRDMFLAKVKINNKKVSMGKALKLYHTEKYHSVFIQKNWMPFEWKGQLLLGYSMNPHEIVLADLKTGECSPLCTTSFTSPWSCGNWRGGTPAALVDGEYLSFFHSSNQARSDASRGELMYHYYMGAYTFIPEPPFDVATATREPIVGDGFYTESSCEKRVVFPGGFAVVGSKIYVAYGKDDCELWIATIDKKKLKKALKPVTNL